MELHFAPLQGFTDQAYRSLHARIYGGVDRYYTPFIRVEKGIPRRQDMTRLRASIDDGTPLVPQIIFNSADEFIMLVEAVKELGFRRIDMNLGCPYPMQTGKGRGSAMIANTTVMRQVAEIVREDSTTSYSVKMRLGMRDANEWQALMPILNDMPLKHITMHARVAKQMYSGEVNTEEFSKLVQLSAHPVIWNGDVSTLADIDRMAEEYPGLKGVMIGRGLLARPSLATEWREGKEWSATERRLALMRFHEGLLEQYKATLCGETQILQKIKPFWEYLEQEIGHKTYKGIRKSTTLARYLSTIRQI